MQSIKTGLIEVNLFAKTLLLWGATLFVLSGCAANRSNFPPKELSATSVTEMQGTTYGHHYVYCDHCPISTMKTASQNCNGV